MAKPYISDEEKAGDADRFSMSRNFLATDKVPDTIFGIPIVADEDSYTPEDLAFFKEHPEAGGYYDMGEENETEDIVQNEAPSQAASKAGVTFDTPLSPAQEKQYQKWKATLPRPLQYEGDYDLRGYWLDPETVKDGIRDGQHFTDRYKKPNHPTFSVESKYAVGAYKSRAGRWDGDRFVAPTRMGMYPGISNNPGNVEKHERRTDKTLFEGEIGDGVRPKRFANFSDPVSGLNATALTIMRRAADLAKEGKDFTIANYAPLYNPPTENDTQRYVRNLSVYSGIPADEVLDPDNTERMASLLRNVVRFESGYPHSRWFTDDEYVAAASLMKDKKPETIAPSDPAKTRSAPGGSARSKGDR